MSLPLAQVLQQIAGTRVLVIGDVIADEYLAGDSSRISAEAPVPVLHYTGEHATLGGAGNTAANVASLGGAPPSSGLVGDDRAGADLAARCARAGIAFVPFRDGRPTTRKDARDQSAAAVAANRLRAPASIDREHEQKLLEDVLGAPRVVRDSWWCPTTPRAC